MASPGESIRWQNLDKSVLWHPFTQQSDWEAEPQLVIERADGCYLIDSDNNPYLDGVSSLWVNVHGHCHPSINRAITEQLERVAHTTFLGLTHPTAIELAQRLVDIAPGRLQRVFYSDTGAAAVEIALKMALQYWQQCPSPQPQRTRFFALHSAYHGDTVGAMSVGGIDLYRRPYQATLFPHLTACSAYCYRCPLQKSYPSCQMACLEEVERVISTHAHELAAVIMEPLVQAAAGIRVYPRGYTRAVWEITRRYGILFIADEVATGFGRTGKMFACEHEGVEPDIMAIGKSLTGGYLPLAATLTTEEIYRAFLGPGRTFYHGHTYTGNPLACAAALASLDLFKQEETLRRLELCIALMDEWLQSFYRLPIVGDIRRCGFMVGIELVQDQRTKRPFPVEKRVAVRVIKEARRRGLILRPLGDVLVIMPPLAIAHSELVRLLDITYASIATVAEQLEEEEA
jgi:adenosylmethionine-8-amino-7-oxononanoate aminotransferase